MPKKTKAKKQDVVEIFKNSRQAGKSITNAEIIKKVVDNDIVKIHNDSSDSDEEQNDRDPDMETDDEKMESLESIVDSPVTSEEDAVQIFRDVMSMTDEDRDMDNATGGGPVRLSPPPMPGWTDDPKNIKFKVSEFVRYKGHPGSQVYKVCGQGKKENTYEIKASATRDSFTENGDKLVKVTDKNVDWVDYWKLNPVIPAPKPWLKKEEPKRKK